MTTPTFKIEDIFSVKDKIVVITGGGTGLGKAIATGFAVNGAKVYITGRRLEVLQKTADEINAQATSGGSVHVIQGDVSTKEGVNKIADQIKAKEQVVDSLINCAGVMKPWKEPIKDHNNVDDVVKAISAVDDEDFRYQQDINVNGVYFTTVAFVPLLLKSDNPSVVIIASIAGLANQRAMGSLTYGVSKAATIHLGTLLAGRLHPLKIRVNTICPGIFPSEMTGKTAGSYTYDMPDAPTKAALRSTMRRPGQPEEIVAPVLMLCSKGGMYTNNALLTVDGGRLMVAGVDDGIRLPDDHYTA
ncbi:hypothetical protein DB88DRAFT_512787 [Papiliotrema laurentii]|uniref:Uncharacterized protein n=1 Tax=Papiliotrema laurentii TaxID=5418 RepID=A0AAD9CST6_PAPLA|nr:hypothetical protein DB88DRAFT_512787 [Papiliotrema laurentii]